MEGANNKTSETPSAEDFAALKTAVKIEVENIRHEVKNQLLGTAKPLLIAHIPLNINPTQAEDIATGIKSQIHGYDVLIVLDNVERAEFEIVYNPNLPKV